VIVPVYFEKSEKAFIFTSYKDDVNGCDAKGPCLPDGTGVP